MQKGILFLFIFLLVICIVAHAQGDARTSADFQLHGAVQIAETRSYFAVTDSSGNLVRGASCNCFNAPRALIIQFNTQQQITEYKVLDKAPDFDYSYTRTYTYDSLHRLVLEQFGSRPSKRYYYNTKSQLISVIHPESEYRRTRPDVRDTFTYDANGRLVEQTRFEYSSFNDVSLITTKTEYDATGRPLTKTDYVNGRKMGCSEYTYGYRNKYTRVYYRALHPYSQGYAYQLIDSLGNTIEEGEKETADSSRHIWQFNEHNDLVREESYRSGKLTDVTEYTYVYDAVGNWIRRIRIENGEPFCWYERSFTYW